VLLFASFFPIYGQEKRSHLGSDEIASQNRQEPASNPTPALPPIEIHVVNGQAPEQSDRAATHSKGYFSRLVAPENLPSDGLFIVGIVGVVVAIRTLRGIERQTKTTEDTLVLTQRPKIAVRMFYFSEVRGAGSVYTPWGMSAGSFCNGQFYIDNCGGTNAKIEEVRCDLCIATRLPTKRPYEGQEGLKGNQTLRPGASITWLFGRSEPLDAQTWAEITTLTTGNSSYAKNFYVLGWIGYTDGLGIYRRTAFCRRIQSDHGAVCSRRRP